LFRARTVFVIGAGASAELGFPLGEKLLTEIAERVDISYDFGQLQRGDYVLADALRQKLNATVDVTDYNDHLHSAWQIAKSSKQALSIDNVLDALEDPKAATVGKFGIVRSILSAEAESPFSKWVDHFPDQIDLSALNGTWLDQLTRLLTEGRRKSEIGSIFENLSIINFNYDRSIEQYLPFSLSNYFGLKPQVVREVMPSLPILRPYGKAGSLPWQGGDRSVEFGHSDACAVGAAADKILTFTEQVQDAALLEQIQNALESAERVIFLGFGFHRQNLQVLDCSALPHVEVLATSYGVSKSDSASIQTEVEHCLDLSNYTVLNHQYVRLYALKCAEFMKEVWRTLTAEAGEDPRVEFPSIPRTRAPTLPSFKFSAQK
jgi:hypothetical protein